MKPGLYKHRAPAERLLFSVARALRRLRSRHFLAVALLSLSATFLTAHAQQLSRDQWGGMPVTVLHEGGNWIIAGKKHKVTLNEHNFAINIETGSTKWSTVASSSHDMLVKTRTDEFA